MKKKLLLPILAALALVILGLALLLTRPDSSSQAPTAPIPYPRPEGSQSLHTPEQTLTGQQSAAPDVTEVTEVPPVPTAPAGEANAPVVVADGTVLSADGDLAIVYNASYNLDIYGDIQTGNWYETVTGSNTTKTIVLYILSRDSTKLSRLTVDVPNTEAERVSTNTVKTNSSSAFVAIVDPNTTSSAGTTSTATAEVATEHISSASAPVAMTLAGIDWTEALRLYTHMDETNALLQLTPTSPDNARAAREAESAYTDYLEQYRQEASRLAIGAPEYCTVMVSVDLSHVRPGTTIDTIMLHIDGEHYALPLGQIRFHDARQETPGNFGASGQGYAHFIQNRNVPLLPWDDGNYTTSFDFTATESMILNRIEVLDENGTVVSGAWIRQVSRDTWQLGLQEGLSDKDITHLLYNKNRFPGTNPNFWDGKSPFYVNAGDRLCIDVEFFDPILAQTAHYQGAVHYALHYTTAQGEAVMYLDGHLQQSFVDLDELYYIYLEDMDLRDYYAYIEHCKDGAPS